MSTTTTGRLAGKRTVITGATGGMGRVACRMFCEAGARVIGTDLDAAAGRLLQQEMASAGHDFAFHAADVTSEADIDALAALARQRWGGLDVLYNNAGIILGKPLLGTTVEEWDRLHAVNTRSVFLAIRAFAPLMGAGGSIVNISSGGGARAMRNMSAYGSSKAGVIMLTKVAALELAPDIRVNAILPGTIDTPMPRNFISRVPAGEQREAAWQALGDGRPLKRVGLPEEVVPLAIFLASDDASFITGVDYFVDGGRAAA